MKRYRVMPPPVRSSAHGKWGARVPVYMPSGSQARPQGFEQHQRREGQESDLLPRVCVCRGGRGVCVCVLDIGYATLWKRAVFTLGEGLGLLT